MLELRIAAIIILFGLSAFFSGSETALFSLSKVQLIKFWESGNKRKKNVCEMISDPEGSLMAILIGNMTVNVFLSTLATGLFIDMLGNIGIIVAFIFITFFLLIFGEVSPKIFSVIHAEGVSTKVIVVLYPFYRVVNFYRARKRKNLEKRELGIEEVLEIINIGHEKGEFGKDEKDMMKRVFEFDKIFVRDIMTPEKEIIMVNIKDNFDKILKTAKLHGISRIPVYERSPSRITGIIYTKDLLKFLREPEKFDAIEIMRKPIHINMNEKAEKALSIFRIKKMHIAIVMDNLGKCAGLITIEDIMERIIGNIEDEYDFEYVNSGGKS